MGDADCGGCFVDVLSACTAASVGIDTEIFFVDFNIEVFFNIRHNIQGYEGGLAFSLCIEGGDAHEAVYSFFGLQVAVSVFAVYLEGNGFDSGFVSVEVIEDFQGKALAFRPSGIHTVKHAAPVAAFCSACACVEFEDSAVFIVFSCKEGADTQRFQFVREGIQF